MYDCLPQTPIHAHPNPTVVRRPYRRGRVLAALLALAVCLVLCAGVLTYLRYTDRLGAVWQGILWGWRGLQWLWQHLLAAA